MSFVKERDKAFIAFVMDDNDKPLKKYCKKYQVPLPKDPKVRAAGVYKAVQECTNIPVEVKQEAFVKCSMLGFWPFINFERAESEE